MTGENIGGENLPVRDGIPQKKGGAERVGPLGKWQ